MYLYGLPLLCLGSIGVGLSRTIPELMAFRLIQAFGTSGGMAVGQYHKTPLRRVYLFITNSGGGIIGDIYKLTERGTAMGVFFGVSFGLRHAYRHLNVLGYTLGRCHSTYSRR
jgi:MFS family permease